jgi:hypothetical protein
MSLQLSKTFSISNSIKLPDWSIAETAYIAGLIDGEGCIGIYRKKNRGNFIQLTVANTDAEVLEWFRGMVHGNSIRCLKGSLDRGKDCYQLIIDRRRAYAVLQRILPYLRIKRKQAELAVKFKEWQETRRSGEISNQYNGHETKTFQEFYDESRRLNRKGVRA